MKKNLLTLLLLLVSLRIYAQTEQRINITTITPSEQTGMDYSPWLTDNLQNLIVSAWGTNLKYVDVTLTLEKKTLVSRLSLYDNDGIFTDNPATIYAINGTQKTLLGTFTGEQYQAWVDINVATPVMADAIVIHKYGNNIPQKIKVFGQPTATGNVTKVRIFTRGPNYEAYLSRYIGGKFQGSNDNSNWTTLYTITVAPAQTSWVEYPISTTTNWRYLRYIASNISFGELHELEFWNNTQKLTGTPFAAGGLYLNNSIYDYTSAFDGNTTSVWIGASAGSQNYAGIDTQTQTVSCSFTPTASVNNAAPACGGSVTLSATCSGTDCSGVSYGWSGNGLNQSGLSVNATVPSSNGVYSYTMTASKAGCVAKTATKAVTVSNCGVASRIKIPIDAKRWYQLDRVTHGLDNLFDGNIATALPNVDDRIRPSFDAYYPLLAGEKMTIDSILLYNGYGNGGNASLKMVLSVITDQWVRVPITTYTGSAYMSWVGPYYPNRTTFKLDVAQVIANARYLVITYNGVYPTEMQLYGTYTPPISTSATAIPAKSIKLKDMCGINGYAWNFTDGNGANGGALISTAKVNAMKSFSSVRQFQPWKMLEYGERKYRYSFSIDDIYQRCKTEGLDVLPCLLTIPEWMQDTWPGGSACGCNDDNALLRGYNNFAKPESYTDVAKLGFQYIARYGSNTGLDPNLVIAPTPTYTGDSDGTTKKIGLGLIKYVECGNERDATWKGKDLSKTDPNFYPKVYQNAREYAATLSAFYDGHKNTMGQGVGVKNADPTVKVVVAGLTSIILGESNVTPYINSDYIKGMVDWCKENRGYKADGTVNLCWDIINYHSYSNTGSSSQASGSTRGRSPDVNPYIKQVAQEVMKTAHELCYDMPVWVTETGFDTNPGSPIGAISIGNKSALLTHADWILRTSLFYARNGIERVFFYQAYDEGSDAAGLTNQFYTSGLLNLTTWTRRPAADYLYQTNKLFGQYIYKETLAQTPFVDRYELNGKSMYAMVVPGETGSTVSYTLALGTATQATIYRPQAGSNDMTSQVVNTVQGKLVVTVTETPLFVIAGTGAPRQEAKLATEAEIKTLTNSVTVFPNPSTDFITVSGESVSIQDLEVNLFDANRGTLRKQTVLNKTDQTFSGKIDISHLPVGLYILEIKQGNERVFRKVLKD